VTVKIVALWSTPTDVQGFEKDYEEIHVPLIAALPGLKGAVTSKALNGPYYRMAELIFEDEVALGSSLGSAPAQALLGDASRLEETFGAKLDVLTVEELRTL
jgi:uncharacterized protein (TIGR02118 family)